MKNLLIIAIMLLSTVNYSVAQRELDISGNGLSVAPSDEPQYGVVYSYLWWFGDGSYRISDSGETTHHYDYSTKTNPNHYITSLITTENYGTEGNPDLIFEPILFESLENTTSDLPKYLDPSDSTDVVHLTSFRNVVPGDTFYLIITYGIPDIETHETIVHTGLGVSLADEDGNSPFEFIINDEWNKSFMPHNQLLFTEDDAQGENIYNVQLGVASIGIGTPQKGEERTVLIPVKYNGTRTEGTVACTILFDYKFVSGGGEVSRTIEFTDGTLKLAASHDPNQVQVSMDTTTCVCGGQELEYEVLFENTGEGQTDYVRIEMQLDEAHDLNTLVLTNLPRWFDTIIEGTILGEKPRFPVNGKEAFYQINEANNTVTFEFHNIFLTGLSDTLTNDPNRRKDYISFKIKIKDDYVIGDPITAFASIIFDKNDPVITNTAETTCPNPKPDTGIDEDCNLYFIGMCWDHWLLYGGVASMILLTIIFLIRRKRNKE